MDIRRLHLLLELSRWGSMRAVADVHGLTTSSVSQQLATLAREVGTSLLEPDGRRVRLTPAGRRLADRAVTILAVVEAARLDLDPQAEPVGTVRVGGFATAIRTVLLPVVDGLRRDHPALVVRMDEYEPAEAFALLEADDLDLALTYDYTLAPASPGALLETTALRTTAWGLGVRTDDASVGPDGAADLVAYREHTWIVNSRNSADEEVVRTLASMAGFDPDVTHQIDSLDLVEDLILAGHGVGLLPRERAVRDGVRVLPLLDPHVVQTTYAVVRRGRAAWAPLRVLLERVVGAGDG